jgi:hypothetical protein
LLERIPEDPSFIMQAADVLCRSFNDQKSFRGFEAKCRAAWEGKLSPQAFVIAWHEANSGKARNPAALWMAVVKRESCSPTLRAT